MTFTPEQIDHGRYLAAVLDNPIQPGENAILYCHRICVIVGSVQDDEGIVKREMPKVTKRAPVETWLPYKDPPDVEDADPYADVSVPF